MEEVTTVQESNKRPKPFQQVIQICDVCGMVDAHANDGHDCDYQLWRQEMEDR